MTDFEAGDVAMVTIFGQEHVAIRSCGGWTNASGHTDREPKLGNVTDVRPLVVVDPEDREQVDRLRETVFAQGCFLNGPVSEWQAALREFANPTPPKPAEPFGLGAVAVDANNVTWVLAGRDLPTSTPDNWRAFDGPIVGDWKQWSRINAVRVLHEGVTP
jgi:hypothetical protein